MKRVFPFHPGMRTRILLPAACLFAAMTVSAQVSETPVTIGLKEGGNPQGYIKNSSDQGVVFSTTPEGRGRTISYDQIRGEGIEKLIRFEERVEVLGNPRSLFAEGKYVEAADVFGKVVSEYRIILGAPRNFASEALFYQLESLRRAGRYQRLASVMDSAPVETIESKLGERYQKLHDYHELWALFGAEKMDELRTALESDEMPSTGDAKLLPTPRFEALPETDLAQLSFLRGKAHAAAGEKTKALDDYYRSMSFAYGNDDLLAKLAMGAAMVMQKEESDLENDERAISEMRSVAYLFAKRFGKDTMPPDFQKFAVRPPMQKLGGGGASQDAKAGAPAEGGEDGAKEDGAEAAGDGDDGGESGAKEKGEGGKKEE